MTKTVFTSLPLTRVSAVATQAPVARFTMIDRTLWTQKAQDASQNQRHREIHRIHQTDDETLHRMINAFEPNTYVRPHRHTNPAKAETFILLSGVLGFIAFRDDGDFGIDDCAIMDAALGVVGVDVPPGTWHSLIALTPGTVVFEVKPGPYQAVSDKDFAPFAPADQDPAAADYLDAMRKKLLAITGYRVE